MAEFPEYKRVSILQNVGVIRADTGAGDVAAGFRRAAAETGAFARELTAEQQKEDVARASIEGANDVFRDDAGVLRVKTQDLSNAAGRARADQAYTRYLTDAQNDYQSAATENAVRLKDPEAFKSFWTAKADGALSEVPQELHGRFRIMLDKVGGETYRGLLVKKDAQATALAHASWNTALQQGLDDARGLAEAGMIGTDTFKAAAAKHEELIQRGVASKMIDPEMADLQRARLANDTQAIGLARPALGVYRTQGPAAAQQWLEKNVLDNPELKLSPEARAHVAAMFQSRINQLEGLQAKEREEVRHAAGDIDYRIARQLPVDATEALTLARRAEAAGDPVTAGRLRAGITSQEAVQTFASLPLPEMQRAITAADAVADEPGSGRIGPMVLDRMKRIYSEKYQAVAGPHADPFEYGAKAYAREIGTVAPVDWSQPNSAVMRERVNQARTIAAYERVPVLPFTNEEIGRLAGAIETSNGSQRAKLSATLADGLGPQYLPAVLGAIYTKGDHGRLFATAAGIGQEAPDVARRIFKGAEVLAASKDAVPDDDAGWRTALNNRLGAVFAERPDIYGATLQAAKALYAADAGEKGDFSKRLDVDRINRAIDEVTGGVIRWRGAEIIPPKRGMSASGFSDVMASLEDGDLGDRPRASDGRMVTADMIRSLGTLTSVGDGRYKVKLRGYDVLAPDGGAYILDLRSVPVRRGAQADPRAAIPMWN